MKRRMRKIIAVLCIAVGIATLAVPIFYHLHGQRETERLMNQFEITTSEEEEEVHEETESVCETEHKEKRKEKKKQTSTHKKKENLFESECVIGVIEIPSIQIRYPVVEGAGDAQIRYAIGHMSETAGIGKKGNCVLCGHNGSRNGLFFTHLSKVRIGDEVKVTAGNGAVYRYQIKETFVVEQDDSTVKEQTKEDMLTLFTCADKGTRRFVCRCTPVRE